LLILSHNNPDPDAIASAWGLAKLIRSWSDADVQLAYSGLLGRAENRELVRVLGEPFPRLEELRGNFDGLIFVDSQPGGGNVTLPEGVEVVGILDHHPRGSLFKDIPFVDIRTHFGSCIALLSVYWREAAVSFDTLSATVFYYAIKSETQELGREASQQDRGLFRQLAQLVDWELLHRIVHAPVPRNYYVTFKVALERARLYGDVLFADAGELPIPDAAAEIAEWLLRLDEVKWALACGTYRGRLVFSLRTLTIGAHCGALSQQIMAGWGSAGGHGMMAGGQTNLGMGSCYDRDAAILKLEQRYLTIMGKVDTAPTTDPFAVVTGELSRNAFPMNASSTRNLTNS